MRILPETASRGTRLYLSPMGFLSREAEIEWIVDGMPVPGRRFTSLQTDALERGNSVQARVSVAGRVFFSNVVTLTNAPPELQSVKLVPEVFRPGDSLGVEVTGGDPDGDEVTFEYAWEKNGVPAGKGSRIDGVLKRNDVIAVTITPFDGEVRGSSLILRREIRNVPPSIEGVKDARLAGDVYSCRILAKDGDGDPLTYALKDAPAGMSIGAATGTIRWEVPPDVRGKVPVAVSVSDGNGGEASYAMVVTVQDETAPQPPGQDRASGESRTRGAASSGQQQ